jgi:hypothetical protein
VNEKDKKDDTRDDPDLRPAKTGNEQPLGNVQARLLPGKDRWDTDAQDRLFIEDLDENLSIYRQHTLLCSMSLPYKNPGNAKTWRRRIGRIRLDVQAGRVIDPNTGEVVNVGLPYGPKARLVLFHLNSLARKARSSKIELKGSFTSFVTRTLRLDGGGRTIRSVKEQLIRLAAANFRFYQSSPRIAEVIETPVVDMWATKDERPRVLWPSTLQFSEHYVQTLFRYSVPLDEKAVSRLSQSALALDIYAWLAYRLPDVRVQGHILIKWASLKELFGSGYGRTDSFKRAFRTALSQVNIVYPTAKFALEEKGLRLDKSDPPVTRYRSTGMQKWRKYDEWDKKNNLMDNSK